mmetsp:Transcript_12629/g.18382  ORF Transcript_12629/g.18382 Transcript_12629/m.18382 type:complete len:143 (-) Transcript_12629:196-624(-)|eukprot:CAMPEP_0194080550 /NCGR_PEP_ID=MMETSP0149-20130528/6550_1 /TAXON_ID=122233 /ORGANISM="Chaetoceros debilis, Strain MM31A-1" /LENGTH=142 /DNA_ID=CAMNT_0038762297 /DNA_START=14 /DNA_END=442 /DNA_ORIENTATION=-
MTQLSSALLTLGDAMFFKPTDEVICERVTAKEDLVGALDGKAEDSSLDVIHIVVGEKDFDRLYDEDSISAFQPLLKDGGELTVHLLCGDGRMAGEDSMNTIQASLVVGGLRFEQLAQGIEDGSYAFTARKGSGDKSDDDDDE